MNEPTPAKDSSKEASLGEFQDALIELLSSGMPLDGILDVLKTNPRFQPYRAYVDDFDPDMVAVASELLYLWGRRKSE